MSGGREPSVWRAPGRVNLIGEHTDYNDGFALPFAIAQGCTARVDVLTEPQLRMSSVQEDDPVSVPLAGLAPGGVDGWGAYVAGGVWAVLDGAGAVPAGLAVSIDSDVPLGAGLSSSAAVVCSVTAAVAAATGRPVSPDDLVRLSRAAENDFVGAPTGGLDQLASVKSEQGAALLCDMRSLATRAVPLDLPRAGLTVLVADSRAPHSHADGEYRARREACRQAAQLLGVASLREVQDDDHDAVLRRLAEAAGNGDGDTLVRRVRHVLTENDRTLRTADLLEAGNVAGIGPLLTESHRSMREDYEITVPQVDVLVDAANAAGALGARMTGGGFGGCVIALVPLGAVDAVRNAMRQAAAQQSFAEPMLFQTAPAAGVHPVDG